MTRFANANSGADPTESGRLPPHRPDQIGHLDVVGLRLATDIGDLLN
jgi:hypothetical protein